ncbi:MAG: hypothetical protein ACJAZS_000800 [Alteromonas naphthalenivorans]
MINVGNKKWRFQVKIKNIILSMLMFGSFNIWPMDEAGSLTRDNFLDAMMSDPSKSLSDRERMSAESNPLLDITKNPLSRESDLQSNFAKNKEEAHKVVTEFNSNPDVSNVQVEVDSGKAQEAQQAISEILSPKNNSGVSEDALIDYRIDLMSRLKTKKENGNGEMAEDDGRSRWILGYEPRESKANNQLLHDDFEEASRLPEGSLKERAAKVQKMRELIKKAEQKKIPLNASNIEGELYSNRAYALTHLHGYYKSSDINDMYNGRGKLNSMQQDIKGVNVDQIRTELQDGLKHMKTIFPENGGGSYSRGDRFNQHIISAESKMRNMLK